jgi:hypothetical protein
MVDLTTVAALTVYSTKSWAPPRFHMMMVGAQKSQTPWHHRAATQLIIFLWLWALLRQRETCKDALMARVN